MKLSLPALAAAAALALSAPSMASSGHLAIDFDDAGTSCFVVHFTDTGERWAVQPTQTANGEFAALRLIAGLQVHLIKDDVATLLGAGDIPECGFFPGVGNAHRIGQVK